jgi:hypothetical protein
MRKGRPRRLAGVALGRVRGKRPGHGTAVANATGHQHDHPTRGMTVRSHRWCHPCQHHGRPMFAGPLAVEEVLSQSLFSPDSPRGIFRETVSKARQPRFQLIWHPSLQACHWRQAMQQRYAQRPRLNDAIAVLPPAFIDTRIETGKLQCGRPVNGDQGGEVRDKRPARSWAGSSGRP